jgi:hypothetical protein
VKFLRFRATRFAHAPMRNQCSVIAESSEATVLGWAMSGKT